MKKILISIRPKWVTKILNGRKTIEVRKTAPKCELPCEVYIYCTKGKETVAINPYGGYSLIPNKYHNEYFSGKVVAKFTLKKVDEIENDKLWEIDKGFLEKTYLSFGELACYLNSNKGYAWHIDNLEILDKPKELNEFKRCIGYFDLGGFTKKIYHAVEKAPQSWFYLEDSL